MESKPIYRTADELRIKQWEREGLIALVGPLSRSVLELDMASAGCGSIHCIGGWLAAMTERSASEYVGFSRNSGGFLGQYSAALYSLFFPEDESGSCDVGGWLASAPQAARAIVNFLTLGDPRWDDVMSDGAA